jgi:uncharacterized protein (DUF2062 family)
MTATIDPAAPAQPLPAAGFWRHRLVRPLRAQLTQGVTPDKLAHTLAVGSACSVFPFLGTNWALNLCAGLWLRMNQPLLQTLNQLLWPIQLPLIFVYVRLGEWLRGAAADRFTVEEVVQLFREGTWGDFFQRFGWAGVHAFTAWALTAPVLLAAVYFPARWLLRRLAAKRPAHSRP